jgi:hypothetical protein
MRNTLILIAIATTLTGGTLSAGDGWGKNQTQRTVGGVLSGATVGGIIGHQHGKQKEGIIIGSVLGMIIGNQSGKGKDAREERQRQEQIAREQAHQRELQRREQERMRSRQVGYNNSNSPIHGQVSYEDKVLMEAQLRAEKAERELQAELERQRQVEERRRALEEYRERERQARERLLRAKGYTPENYPNLFQ